MGARMTATNDEAFGPDASVTLRILMNMEERIVSDRRQLSNEWRKFLAESDVHPELGDFILVPRDWWPEGMSPPPGLRCSANVETAYRVKPRKAGKRDAV